MWRVKSKPKESRYFILTMLLAALSWNTSSTCLGQEKYRESVFEVGISANQLALTGKDGFKVIGNSGVINLGGGFIAPNYFSLTSLNIILGPYQPLDDYESRLDYTGTGLSSTIGWAWNKNGVRRPKGSFGPALSFEYLDIVGRSVGTRTLESGTIRDQVNQIYSFSLTPGFFFANLKKARPTGHSPELLTTRLEGVIIFVGIAYPVKSDYTQEYLQALSGENEKKIKTKGDLDGRSYIVSIIAPLGV